MALSWRQCLPVRVLTRLQRLFLIRRSEKPRAVSARISPRRTCAFCFNPFLLRSCTITPPSNALGVANTSFNTDQCNHRCLKPRRRSARSCFICATSSRASASIAPRSFNNFISSLLSAALVLVSSAILCFD